MKRKKLRGMRIEVEAKATRYQPDPHRRARVIENKKTYSRKARDHDRREPFDCLG